MDNLNLEEIKKALKKIDRKRRAKRRAGNFRIFKKVNKNYRKLDWTKSTFTIHDLRGSIEDTALPVFRKMRNYGWVRTQFNGNSTAYNSYYLRSNIENLFLLQELMCQMDDNYWFQRVDEKPKKIKHKYIPFYYNSKYLGKVYIGSFPQGLEWKQELLNEFLKDKEYIFDERTPYGRPLKEVCRFLGKNLINGKVEKWDFYYKRFLAKNH